MATQSIDTYRGLIYSDAMNGTPTNPGGLPASLASLLVDQAQHETGNFSSNAFIQDNNAFGYSWVPGGRWQIGMSDFLSDNGQPVAEYATVADSVSELVDWIYRRRAEGKFPADLSAIDDPVEYAQLLKDSNYYGDTVTNYAKGLAYYFKQNLLDPIEAATGISGQAIAWGLAAGVAVYLLTKKGKTRR